MNSCIPETRGEKDFWGIPYFHEKLKQPRNDLLFLGDSVTDFWTYALDHEYPGGLSTWNERYKDIATNFGITGEKTQTVLWRLTEGKSLEGYSPTHIVLLRVTGTFTSPTLGMCFWKWTVSFPTTSCETCCTFRPRGMKCGRMQWIPA
jgi:hypothetical protein